MAKKKRGQFEIFRNAKGEQQARLVAGNGEIIAGGEGYTRRRGVERFIQLLRDCHDLPVVDVTFQKPKGPRKKVTPAAAPAQNTLLPEGEK